MALRPGIYLRHTDVVKSVNRTRPASVAGGTTGAAAGASLPVTSAPGGADGASLVTSTNISTTEPDICISSEPAGTPAAGSAPVAAGTAAPLGSERGTRARIARLILENGPVTAAALSTRLGLTPAAVRRHLDNLLASGLIEARTARRPASRGRGRPAKLFAITDAGRSVFEHAYDDLATSALRFIAEVAGPGAVAEFARRQVADLERRYRQAVVAATAGEKVKALAEALSADGYAASAASAPTRGTLTTDGGEQLCQHHCPVAHVAAEFPQLCEAETEAFARLLGTPVQRLATIAHGDGICTTHVTAPALVHTRTTTPTRSPEASGA
jgi:predicted ArsR family transcriptional regulator